MRSAMLVIVSLATCLAFGETARFRAYVVDADTGEPITGRTVCAWFSSRNMFSQDQTVYPEQVTDDKGMCRFSGSANCSIGCAVDADENWYKCSREVHFTGVSRLMFNRLQPDNQIVTMAVQRVQNPIPLHIMRITEGQVTNFFGVGNDTLRYDMLVCDWLPPKGTGVVADVVFRRLPPKLLKTLPGGPWHSPINVYHSELSVSFPGEGNGIVEVPPLPDSGLKCRTAPETGYGKEIRAWASYDEKRGGPINSWDDDTKVYCFRIRSKVDSEGRLTEGNYGKIYYGLRCTYSKDKDNPIGGVDILYYLNRNNLDRNLEWDSRNNINTKEYPMIVVHP